MGHQNWEYNQTQVRENLQSHPTPRKIIHLIEKHIKKSKKKKRGSLERTVTVHLPNGSELVISSGLLPDNSQFIC